MSKGKIDKNSSFFKNLENIYAAKSGIKKPHKEIKKEKVVEVPQQKQVTEQIQQIPQQIQQQVQVPQQIQVPQHMYQNNPPQNIIINVLGNNQSQSYNNHYIKCPNCQYTFVNNSNNPFLQYMK